MAEFRILFADDSKTLRALVGKHLIDAGYDVVVAEDGRRAIELAHQTQPDLAILDVLMPDMDGYEVCNMLKATPGHLSQIPIIFLTSVESRALNVLGEEFGAYLRKPVEKLKLLQVVREQLGDPRHSAV